jgi:MSHA biogenesis protein MshO
MKRLPAAAQRGFTLVEAIIVIVIIGALSAVVAVFIRAPVQGYVDSVGRAEVSDQADLALRRMARDIRLALPNSIRVNTAGTAIEFLLTKTGGRYLAVEDEGSGQPLDFLHPAPAPPVYPSFTVVGPMPGTSTVAAGDYVVVNNLGPGLAPADAYQFSQANRNIAVVRAYDAANSLITLQDNPFAAQTPTPLPSPNQRFQVVSGPVSYVCAARADGTLEITRQSGYSISVNQNVPPQGAQSIAVLASRIDDCSHVFQYDTAAAQRSALVIVALALRTRNQADPPIRLVQQVHVDNTP